MYWTPCTFWTWHEQKKIFASNFYRNSNRNHEKKWIKGSLFRGKKKYKLHREEKERERAGERVYEYKEPQFKLNIC